MNLFFKLYFFVLYYINFNFVNISQNFHFNNYILIIIISIIIYRDILNFLIKF